MEIDRDDYRGDEADRADLYIESVIDDHVKEAMRQLLRFLLARRANARHAANGQCVWWMKPARRAGTSLQSITHHRILKWKLYKTRDFQKRS